MKAKVKKKILVITSGIILSAVFFLNTLTRYHLDDTNVVYRRKVFSGFNDSLIYSPKCTIPNLDPFNEDVQNFFYKKSYISCNSKEPLTYISYKDDGTAMLNINKSMLSSYSWLGITCCYASVVRDEMNPRPDDIISVSECVEFDDQVEVDDAVIQVTCSTFLQTVYSNVHAVFVEPEPNPLEEPNDYPSVLIIGIDSISRLNLQRTMPQTYTFLERSDWIPLKGYNKIADNTFPNVFAFLTGMDDTEAEHICGPFTTKCLDDCDFIWKKYKFQGYTTMYSEDWSKFGTFNYYRKGFCKPPTDYYFRPYFLAADQLPAVNTFNGISYCSGPETSGERIFNMIRDASLNLNTKPIFGLFWMNTFSHNNINDPTMMDEKVYQFLEELTSSKYPENKIIIFLSDHGFRFGKIRYTFSGWLEERLPFIYIHLPESFKNKYPDALTNLRQNSELLTNPYNLYATMEHILQLNDNQYKLKGSFACPKCKSLFQPPEINSCEESGIKKHWCSCTRYKRLEVTDPLVIEAANFVLNELTNVILSFGPNSRKCSEYVLYKITSSSISPPVYLNESEETRNLLIVFETLPEAAFEATVSVHYTCNKTNHKLRLSGDISRLDRYAGKVLCVESSALQKYCYCPKMLTRFQNYFCNKFYCLHI